MPTYIQNKKAYADYEILETFEAGLCLLGHEVKSLRQFQGSLRGAYIIIRGREAFLVNASIPPFQERNVYVSYDDKRIRKLLLRRREIRRLAAASEERGLTIVPLSVYNKVNRLKIEIAIVRRRKKYDKREVLKQRDTEREISRQIKEVR